MINGSAYHPFGVMAIEGPIMVLQRLILMVIFLIANWKYKWTNVSLFTHNLVLEVPEAKMMAYGYRTSALVDYCNPKCTFEVTGD